MLLKSVACDYKSSRHITSVDFRDNHNNNQIKNNIIIIIIIVSWLQENNNNQRNANVIKFNLKIWPTMSVVKMHCYCCLCSTMKKYIKNLCIFLMLLVVSANKVKEQQNSKQYNRNVIFVIFDDMRPAIGLGYGDRLARTPHLDSFINESFYFTRAYSQQALCAPSRNSMLTSRRPDTLHLYDFYNYWRTNTGNFSTLPQYFKEHGYRTYSVGKVFHAGISSNNTDDYPYSWSVPTYHPRSEKFMNSPVCPDRNGILRKNLICPVTLKTQPYKTLPDIESVAESINILQNQQNDKPIFLAIGFHKPHINLRFPRNFLKKFNLNNFYNYTQQSTKPYNMPNVAWNPYTDVRARDDFKHNNISFPYGPISDIQSAEIRQAYYASISYVDKLFGDLMKIVNKTNTIVVVTSDHGWSLGEHGEWAKYSNFEVSLRVPLIIRSPEFPLVSGQPINGVAELLDIFPTLVDLAHLPKLPKCPHKTSGTFLISCTEGKSLYGQFKSKTAHNVDYSSHAVSQYPRPGQEPTKHPNSDKPKLKNIKVMGYSLRTDCCRYTLWVRFFPQNFTRDWNEVYGEELYDHRFDAAEEINLITLPEFHEERLQMRQKLMNAIDI